MGKTLRELLIDYASNKQTFRRAQNHNKFLALWPEIKAMLDEGWSLRAINEVTKAHGMLDLHYDSFRRYVIKKRRMEDLINVGVTPEKKNIQPKSMPVQNTRSERKMGREQEEKPPPYSVPPKFTGGRGDDDEDITTFLLGKGK